MQTSAGIRAALFAALACACGAQPDIVATERAQNMATDASVFGTPKPINKCQAGQYQGLFTTDTDPDASAFQLNGDFSFSIVQVIGGEFPTLADNSSLTGTASSFATFKATVGGGSSCVDGKFNTTIDNGEFSVVGGTTSVAFDGKVQAHYDSFLRAFTGQWDITIAGTTTHLGGYWSATLFHPQN